MAVETSPMLEQYRRLKAEHPGTILLFRMGDFYETFYDDAILASKVLGIALTSRDKNKAERVPLAGVPHHAVDGYLRTLVTHGHSVAIAEQMEGGEPSRGLMERQIVEVLTPGTLTRSDLLDANESNYIAAIAPSGERIGIAVAEVSTGEFRAGTAAREDLASLLLEYPVREIVLPSEAQITTPPDVSVARLPVERFDSRAGRAALTRKFHVLRLDSFGVSTEEAALGAAGALLGYLQELKKSDLPQIRRIQPLREGTPLVVD
ncbi:MAG TPA: DNA mismatch repair protein MutS, partial [Candidatus Eisenbacteria bacterium]